MKQIKVNFSQKDLRNFAESLTAALEEVADKISTIEGIINGTDDTEDDVVEEPVADTDTETEEVSYDAPVEEDDTETAVEEPAATMEGDGEATEEENFSEKRYQSVKDYLSL